MTEKQTVRQMIEIYCRGKHHTRGSLCEACGSLLAYAEARLAKCPFEDKPACKDCKVHCYAPDQRQAIQDVMRYAGPRMLLANPRAALAHLARVARKRPPE